ncbi:MAG TPA: fibronectin type III domain-containing protein [Candidatus Hydrogenedentes bacterium]|nr:fibronectin type III domain-containing protein [Candidatus Hydrogenedentota bacterium]
MPNFPKRDADIVALADAMIAGYGQNPSVFPHADVATLQSLRAGYQTKKNEQLDADAKAQLATEAKDGALDALEGIMKVQLRQSEVDTADDSEKLELIGWGPKAPAQPSNPPGQPRNLDPVIQGPSTLFLDWKSPAPGPGGRVRTYLIERRKQVSGGAFNEWHQVGVALDSELTLTEQPRNVQLEYRIIAVNNGGNSVPSNTAAVVL